MGLRLRHGGVRLAHSARERQLALQMLDQEEVAGRGDRV